MNHYEFLAEMALKQNESSWDDVEKRTKCPVNGKKLLVNAPLITKARILSTGLNADVNTYEGKKKVSQIKNGTKGYPGCLRSNKKTKLDDSWLSTFMPSHEHMRNLPDGSVLFQFDLVLTQPFFSRDDTSFYPIDNAVRKEHVFGAAYLGASAIKGLFRWAWRICWGNSYMNDEIYFFGPRSDDMKDNKTIQGCLYTYPVFWDGDLGLDIINPHKRSTLSGSDPVKYEVVKIDSKATLNLLWINKNGDEKKLISQKLERLRPVIKTLLVDSGLSAKRGSGWGAVNITDYKAAVSIESRNDNVIDNEESPCAKSTSDLSDVSCFTKKDLDGLINTVIKCLGS